jgi:hypothetical protein
MAEVVVIVPASSALPKKVGGKGGVNPTANLLFVPHNDGNCKVTKEKQMKSRLIILSVLFALMAAAALYVSAHAQGCFDPSGAPIDCPDYQNPTKTPVPPTPTSTPLPLAIPTDDGVAGFKSATCAGGADAAWMLSCTTNLVNKCGGAGGVSTIDPPDSAGGVTVNCSKDVFVVIEPTPFPLSLPERGDGWIGTCTEAAGDLADCIDNFKCEDGLLVVKVDIYNGIYDFYCIPHDKDPETVFPIGVPLDPGADDNWVGGCSGGDGMGACLDEMKAACDEEGGEYSEWYDDEGAGAYCQNSSEGALPPGQPGGLPGSLPPFGLGALIGVVGAIAIPAFMKNARKAKTAEATTNVKKMYEGARAQKPAVPTPDPQVKVTTKSGKTKAKMLSTVSMKIRKPGK